MFNLKLLHSKLLPFNTSDKPHLINRMAVNFNEWSQLTILCSDVQVIQFYCVDVLNRTPVVQDLPGSIRTLVHVLFWLTIHDNSRNSRIECAPHNSHIGDTLCKHKNGCSNLWIKQFLFKCTYILRKRNKTPYLTTYFLIFKRLTIIVCDNSCQTLWSRSAFKILQKIVDVLYKIQNKMTHTSHVFIYWNHIRYVRLQGHLQPDCGPVDGCSL